MPLRFAAAQRLRKPPQFEAVYAKGKRCADGYFSVVGRANGLAHPRLGLAVSLKATGGAVARNRVRRIVRESFRLRQHELPALDLVVSARPAVRAASATALRDSLEGLWKRIAKQCVASPAS